MAARRAKQSSKPRRSRATSATHWRNYVLIGVSILVALTMIVPSCEAFATNNPPLPPATAR
jgi:hypothetical protein